MSIYGTLWTLRFPRDGIDFADDGDPGVMVFAQQVPPHIQNTGEHWAFLPPPVSEDDPHDRAVVITTSEDKKGTKNNGQEYHHPLLVLRGDEYAAMSFDKLYQAVMAALIRRKIWN